MKKIYDFSFSISFKINRQGESLHIMNDLKSKIKNRFKHHIKNITIDKKGFGLFVSTQEFLIKKEINNKKMVIANFKIKEGKTFSKNVLEKGKIFRKDFYITFFISINPYTEKLPIEMNFKNPRVRDNIYDYLRNIYKPIKYD